MPYHKVMNNTIIRSDPLLLLTIVLKHLSTNKAIVTHAHLPPARYEKWRFTSLVTSSLGIVSTNDARWIWPDTAVGIIY